jgi:2-oxo-4-hydroxy-4-carboxy-5-ureidoimidazoline decarboxylase
MEVARFDELGSAAAAEVLLPCCASWRWVSEMVDGRPYGSLERLAAGADAALSGLRWADVEQALAAHRRIGAQRGDQRGDQPGDPAGHQPGDHARREAAWSAQEQRGAATLGVAARDQLLAANVEYEQRFGHVFLICATGKSAEQMMDSLEERLGHETSVEREVVRVELRDIVALRLAKAFR